MNYVISGKVIHGDGYGKKLGFPTMNLDAEKDAFIKDGVYAGVGVLEGKEYQAGIVIGPGEKIEAHLIGYNGDAYGKEVALKIGKFIREYKKFDTEGELIIQITKDIEAVKNLC